jgi:hypothetical protein
MLKAFKDLADKSEGRYATDDELQFIDDYVNSYSLRLSTYYKLQQIEQEFVETVHQQLTATDPALLKSGTKNLTPKWKHDTMRVLRYSAIALLLDDAEIHQERFLFWFQTIMRAFSAQRSCDVTYTLMQEVAKNKLSANEAALLCPILELNRVALGTPPPA